MEGSDEGMKGMREGGHKKRARGTRVIALALLVLCVLLTAAGCVTQAEIEAARQQYNAENSPASGATPAPAATPAPGEDIAEPLEPIGEEGDGGELGASETLSEEAQAENSSQGLIENLLGMLGSRSESLQIIALLTILSLAPSVLIMLTGFMRIIMIFSFLRNAMGLQQMPPNQVVVGLALFLTFFIMYPVIEEIKTEAYIPYAAEIIEIDEAVERGVQPIREFMVERTRTSDLGMFYSFTDEPVPETDEQVYESPMRIVIPAFLTSELRRAFEIGFFLYIPFIVIDMIVASTLMSMGMMMLPPIVISMPFKVLMFVLVDGWALLFETIVRTFT